MTNIFVKTFGCSANFSDSEIMQGLLKEADFTIVDKEGSADLIILNVCTVKGESAALKEIRKTHETHPFKKIIIAGCITQEMIPEVRDMLPDVSFISTHNIKEIVQVVEETLHDNPVSILAKKNCKKILLPRCKKNKTIGIVQIASGCVSRCSYCSTKLIKGELKSHDPKDIIEDIKNLLKEGCREIWLTAQDTACYGFDIDTDLPELLKKVCDIDGNFRVRLGMGNPKHFKNYIDRLVAAFKHPKMFKFLHIPVQSGNDQILNAMNRGYSVEEFEDIITKFRREIPDITISTDIIAGFPGESNEQFNDSLKMVKKIRPSILNISRFIPRENTKAFDMTEHIHGGKKKERSRKLTSLHEWLALEENRKWKNWEGPVLIDEHNKDSTCTGRNFAYKPVVIKGILPLGDRVMVKITNIAAHYLVGEVMIDRLR